MKPAVTRRVSAETSTVKLSGVSATAVRQTPLTAMLSPSATSEKSSPPPVMTMRASAPRASYSWMRPMAWMMPVNMR